MNDELLIALVRLAARSRGVGLFAATGVVFRIAPGVPPAPLHRVALSGVVEATAERWSIEPTDSQRKVTLERTAAGWTLRHFDLMARTYVVTEPQLQLDAMLGPPRELPVRPRIVVYPLAGMPPYSHVIATAAPEPGRHQC